MMHKAWSCIGEVPYCFSRSSLKFQGHTGQKICRFWPELGVSHTVTPVWIHQWLWNDAQSLKQHMRGALVFQGHSSNFKVTRDKNCRFWPELSVSGLTQVWHHRGVWNDAQSWCGIEEVSYCFSRSSIQCQGHTGQNIANFDPNRAFLDCNSSLNSPMDLKWCTKPDVV